MFGLTTIAKLRAAEDAALQMRIERDAEKDRADKQASRADEAERKAAGLREDVCAAEAAYEKGRREGKQKGRLASEMLAERDAAHDKLREVVAAETPACAGIGRKMARIAREGLPEYAVPAETAEAA